ncbi:hypothetical protein AB4Z29_31155 [Paenibacillus sp. 2TAB23]|uniref:hypothetical protein n=1 Tax=Paenibacillus sp. 2TAB23 TaxID=3233004 RepID=UPI003F984255
MDSVVHAGSFDSEAYWKDSSFSKLPAILDEQRAYIVMAMDELLFPFCAANDGLITRFSIDHAQKDYLHRIGFSFSHLECADVQQGENIFHPLLRNTHYQRWLTRFQRIAPYAVLEQTTELLQLNFFEQKLPSYNVVKHVNSKMYSTELSEQLTGVRRGASVTNATELAAVCHEMLATHGAALVKDPFGVSGNGNIKLKSPHAIERMTAYIRSQEHRGKVTELVVEPLLRVARDFSCHFEIAPDGSTSFIGMQEILNHQFAYQGSAAMREDEKHELECKDYFQVMEQVGLALNRQGYFGPVCVDSMQLTDGTLIPIVEINARKSMGLINVYLNRALSNRRCQGILSYLSVGYYKKLDYGRFLCEMQDASLLYPQPGGSGIVPLSSAALLVNQEGRIKGGSRAEERNHLIKGRLYISVFAENLEERQRLVAVLRTILMKLDVSIYD